MTDVILPNEKWPNFFIVGARKAGTTSLYEYLQAVPSIYMSKVKEPNYFSSHSHPFDSWTPVVRDKEKYLDLFKAVKDEKAIGEASTSYLYAPEAPERIKRAIPSAHIIIILRDPIQRAFSHYLMNFLSGQQKLSLYEALQKDYFREDKALGRSFLYVELGLYFNQVKRYFDSFGKKNVKILIFEEFTRQTKSCLEDVLSFLQVCSDPPQNIEKAYNTFFTSQNKISRLIFKSKTVYRISQIIPETPFKEAIRNKLRGKSVEKPKVSDEAWLFLENIYKEDVRNLERLLERPLPWDVGRKV